MSKYVKNEMKEESKRKRKEERKCVSSMARIQDVGAQETPSGRPAVPWPEGRPTSRADTSLILLCLHLPERGKEMVNVCFPGGSGVKASAWNAGDPGSIPGLGRSPGEGNGNPLQYSCLKNPMDGGAWRATVRGVPRVGHDWATSLSLFLSSVPTSAATPGPLS